MYPIIDAETVELVSLLRAQLDDSAEPDVRLVQDLVQRLTPDFQRDSASRRDDEGTVIIDVATCGVCGRSWDDALGSSLTPADSGRCPFEYDHDEIDRDEIKAALEGDSNDAEHDALESVAIALGIDWTPYEDQDES